MLQQTIPITYADNKVHLLRRNFLFNMFLSNSFYDVITSDQIAMMAK